MNDKGNQRTKLIAELFHGEWSDGTAAEYARKAASLARTRRARRRTVWTTVAGMAAAGLFVWTHPAPKNTLSPPPTARTPAYEVISDDELLADLHDRPLLVLRNKNGDRQFVMLSN
jgi:hypothetical protein